MKASTTKRQASALSLTVCLKPARGPRKKRAKGARAPRHTGHKKRAGWFQARASWPFREAAVDVLAAERRAVAARLPRAPGTTLWELAGPENIGGRSTAIVCDSTNPDRIWLGAAGGGVWFSANGGLTWTAQWHRQPVLNIGALAIHPTDPNILYCGTGEANLSADSYPGNGLWTTINGGRTWKLLASAKKHQLPRRIGVIAVDPFDPQHIRLGGVSHSPADVDGLFVSRDAGRTWTRETFVGNGPHQCHEIVFDPSTLGVMFTSFTNAGSAGGIWRSRDGGATWQQLTSGLDPAAMGRTRIAIAPSRPAVIYAQASDNSDLVLGIFKSTDGGNTWSNVARSHFRDEGQMFYGNAIVVHPTDHQHVLCGGVDLHRTTDGGATWRRVTQWDANRGTPQYAHADHHALLMPAARPGLVYDANDGGLDVSANGGTAWQNRSAGLATNMFYDMDAAQSNAALYGGGAQDNGTLITSTAQPSAFFEVLGGDGGWMAIDPGNPAHFFASWQGGNLIRWKTQGIAPVDVTPPLVSPADDIWMAIVAMDHSNTRRLFLGTKRVWRTVTDGSNWTAVSPVLDGSAITTIEIAPADPRRIYVGTENGGIFRSMDGGTSWSADLSTTVIPGHTVTRLETDPGNASLVYAVTANFSGSHVFLSNDGGITWADIDRGLPNVPHHAVVTDPANPATLWVGNDLGVFVSNDRGTTWQNLSRNLPFAMIVDLVLHAATRTLFAATYGRSIWKLAL